MSATTKKDEITKIIRESLELDRVDESYVATKKEYALNTELLDKKLKTSHEDLYAGYVETLNRVSARGDTIDRTTANSSSSGYRALKQDEVYNMNAVYLHELYFANISDQQSVIHQDMLSYMRLSRDFGTFDAWQDDFIACAMSAREGWACTVFSTFLQRYINVFIDSHDLHVPMGCIPVVVIDMWAHSYHRNYLNDKRAYVRNMMRELNWDVIERRVLKSDMCGEVLAR